jgi:hypothetical protein
MAKSEYNATIAYATSEKPKEAREKGWTTLGLNRTESMSRTYKQLLR